MAQSKGRDAISLSDFNAGGFLVFETKRVEAVKEAQTQLLDTFEQFNLQQTCSREKAGDGVCFRFRRRDIKRTFCT